MRSDPAALAAPLGFDHVQWIRSDQIVLSRMFREQCAANACGIYGKCWMCPPDIGDIDTMMKEIRKYPYGLLYQSIHPLEDSFDFEGMQEGGHLHNQRSRQLDEALRRNGYTGFLHLSKGGCGICSSCAKVTGEPCRFPQKALSSLEAYGVNVSATAKNASMKYINGVNTVTYFGLVLFKESVPCLD